MFSCFVILPLKVVQLLVITLLSVAVVMVEVEVVFT